MKVIAISEFLAAGNGNVDQSSQLSAAARVLLDLHDRGILTSLYLRKDRPGIVLMLECGTEDDAHKSMQALPGVQAGSTTYDLFVLGSEVPPNALLAARMAST